MVAEVNDFEHWENRMDAETIFGDEIIPNIWHKVKRVYATHIRPVKGKGSRSYPKNLESVSGCSASYKYPEGFVLTEMQLYHSCN